MTEEKTITIELTEEKSAIMLISLELRKLYVPPHGLADKRRLNALVEELKKKHSEAFP